MSHQSELIATDIEAYLAEHERKDLLRFLTCGSVDDGKSTLIGRLLHDSHMIYEDQLASLEADSTTQGSAGDQVDLALLLEVRKAPLDGHADHLGVPGGGGTFRLMTLEQKRFCILVLVVLVIIILC